VMVLAQEDSMRETIAFPKTGSGAEPMTGAPSKIGEPELRELHIKVVP